MNGALQTQLTPAVVGKFLYTGRDRFLIKGVTYGTFAPGPGGVQFPPRAVMVRDLRLISAAGINTIRTYTPPSPDVLDEAARRDLRVMVGVPWTQHVAFLDDRRLCQDIRRNVVEQVRALGGHPATLMFSIGNEIPSAVVRWHGRARVECFLRELYDAAKDTSPDSLVTYVNYPPTEYLDLPFLDLFAFNVYLHEETELRDYLAHLHHLAGHKPLLLAEAGADGLRHGEARQAAMTSMQLRAAFEEGACGAIAFAWTDEWWRGGERVDDWAFGLVDVERRVKPVYHAAATVFGEVPFSTVARDGWPQVSVVVCAFNAADTIEDCLSSLDRLKYPHLEVIVIDDGSRDETVAIVRQHPGVRLIESPHGGLGAARNAGMRVATGEIIAYVDADVRVDADWLAYLVQPFLTSDVAAVGGPNVVPADDPWFAQCVARSPGGPTHVLLDDRTAEHVPGCNMAIRRESLLAIGGFDPRYVRAGDDVDVCWRLDARGWRIGFAPSALVWHHHRATLAAYWRQQVGYGEGEAWLMAHHPEKCVDGRPGWRGRIYSPLPFARALSTTRVNSGVFGTAAFPAVYHGTADAIDLMPHSPQWQLLSLSLLLAGVVGMSTGLSSAATWMLVAAGAGGIVLTLSRCVAHAVRSDVETLPRLRGLGRRASRGVYITAIAWLHFLQPLARVNGYLRGLVWPPRLDERGQPAGGTTSRITMGELRQALRMCVNDTTQMRFWSESWVSSETILKTVIDRLRALRVGSVIQVDDGWQIDRDVSVCLGRWVRVDLRVLAEDHGGGRCLLRTAQRLRTHSMGRAALALGLLTVVAEIIGGTQTGGVLTATSALVAMGVAGWLGVRTMAMVTRVIREVTEDAQMVPIPRSLPPSVTPTPAPARREAEFMVRPLPAHTGSVTGMSDR